jgi:sialate O-acetylesterase
MSKRFFITAALCVTAAAAFAEVKLPSIFSNHMILQQGQEDPVWGWADAGESVTVNFAGQTVKTTAAQDGGWKLALKALTASAKPAVFTVNGSNVIALQDVLVGEVWFCSGQSNMELTMRSIENAEVEIKNANNPLIRHYKASKKYSPVPLNDVPSKWLKTTPETIPGMSAVAYMFGRRLYQDLKVPIGLINSSWGGTRIDPWTPTCGYDGIPALESIKNRVNTATPENKLHKKVFNDYIASFNKWQEESKKNMAEQKSLTPAPQFPKNLVFESTGRGVQQQPTVLWNAMVAGIAPFAIKGSIWYQGESNRGEGMLYLEKTKALVNGWRHEWKIPDLPYYVVQLAPYKYGGSVYTLPEIWEAQAAMPEAINNTGYTVINDIATLSNIHPPNKQDVGLRMGNQALNRTYGKTDIEWSGPMYKSYKIEGNKIRISFKYAQGLKTRDGKTPDWFEIYGADGTYEKATAVIDGESILISSPDVSAPTGFRFAWHQLATPNLINHRGLPTGAFRDGKKMKLDGAKTMKELKGFRPVYEIDIAANPQFANKPPVYKVDNSKSAGEFTQVAYLLQLQSSSSSIKYVMTSMNAFSKDVSKLAIPHRGTNSSIQKKVTNLTVRSNAKNVPALTNDNGGCIEFGASNYGPPCSQKLPGGNSSKYDFDDTISGDCGYGCMQVHSWKAKTTLFAINNFNSGAPLDIGIGNNTKGEHPDYTFMKNGGDYTLRRLTIFVK